MEHINLLFKGLILASSMLTKPHLLMEAFFPYPSPLVLPQIVAFPGFPEVKKFFFEQVVQ